MCEAKKTNKLLEVIRETINSNLEELVEDLSLDLISNFSTELSLKTLVDIMLECNSIIDIIILLREKAIDEGTILDIKYPEEIVNDNKNKRKKIKDIIALYSAIKLASKDFCTCTYQELVLDECICGYAETLNKAKHKLWDYIETLESTDND